MDLFMDVKQTGDLVWNNGPSLVKSDFPDVVVQRVYIKLRTFAGEWLFNETYGVDYLGQILGKRLITKEFIDGIIQEAILDEDGVSEISYWESSLDGLTRSYQCRFKIRDTQRQVVSELVTISNIF